MTKLHIKRGKGRRKDSVIINLVDEQGNKFWRLNGKFHREDGPAIECADGDKS